MSNCSGVSCRLWKRHSARRRDLREQRQLAAADALSSLSLGPRVQWKNDVSFD